MRDEAWVGDVHMGRLLLNYLMLAAVHAVPVVLAGLALKRWGLHATGVAMCVVGFLFGTPAFALYDIGAVAIA